MIADEVEVARAEIKLPDGTLLRALPDRLVHVGQGLGSAQENELYYRHIAGISVTRRSGLAGGLLVGLLFFILAGYVYFQLQEFRTWAFGLLIVAILAPVIGAFLRTQVYQLFSAGWPGGKWEISAEADREGKLLAAIRQGCSKPS